MARQFLTDLNLNNNELQNVVIQNVSTLPAGVEGKIVFNTTTHTLHLYRNSAWVTLPLSVASSLGLTAGGELSVTFASQSEAETGTETAKSLSPATGSALVADRLATEASTARTLTNKSIDADDNTITDLSLANFKSTKISLGTSEAAADAVAPSLAKVEELITAGTPDATETTKGIARLATQAEALAGQDDTTIVTPAKMHYAIEQNIKGAVTYKGAFATQAALEAYEPIQVGDLFVSSASAPITIGTKKINAGDWVIFRSAVAASTTLTGTEFDVIDATDEADIVRLDATQTLTNKTIDADDNTISDLTLSNLKSGVLVTDLSSAQADDSTIASAKAVQAAISAAAPGVDDVTIELYDNTSGGGSDHDLRLKDGGITMPKFNANALSLGTSETQASAVLPSQAKVGELIVAERDATATLTNHTIDLATTGTGAGNNTITNAQVGIFASGVVVDSTAGIGPASGTGAATDDELPTALAVREAINASAASGVHVYSEDNEALTPSSGVVTWTVTHGLDRGKIVQVQVFEKTSGEEVVVNVARTATTVTLSWNASANVAAGTYTVVVIG